MGHTVDARPLIARYGIFRLIEPRGLKEVLTCKKGGFHPDHDRVYTVGFVRDNRERQSLLIELSSRIPRARRGDGW